MNAHGSLAFSSNGQNSIFSAFSEPIPVHVHAIVCESNQHVRGDAQRCVIVLELKVSQRVASHY
jgi:hypothetical protein